MEYDVFISYSRKDMAVADEITRALDAAGITYFIDRQGIAGGMEFPVVLARAIVESRVFLYLASRNSYVSKFTNNEITFAFNKKEKNCILPYIIDDSQLPLEIEFVFAGINWRTRSQHSIPTLVADLRTLLGRPTQAAPSKPTQAELEEWWKKGKAAYDNKDYAEALKWYKKSAEQGYAKAQFALAVMYEFGMDIAKDMSESARWTRKAAEQGHATAQCSLGYMYNRGAGVVRDMNEAIRWFRKSAEQGNEDAKRALSKLIKPTEAELEEWWRKGDIAYNNKDYAEALKWYKKGAEQGHAKAQNGLGLLYDYGRGVLQDRVEAVRWYRKAAEQGYAIAQFNLGNMYESGDGVAPDLSEAVRWYRKAAEQGHSRAQHNMGRMYEFGTGVAKDKTEAIRWYRKAANQGDEYAKKALYLLSL